LAVEVREGGVEFALAAGFPDGKLQPERARRFPGFIQIRPGIGALRVHQRYDPCVVRRCAEIPDNRHWLLGACRERPGGGSRQAR